MNEVSANRVLDFSDALRSRSGSSDFFSRYVRKLETLERKNRLRHLRRAEGIDFSSNDYLALANSDHLKEAALAALSAGIPLGAGGSRLLRGNCLAHESLEAMAADFFGAERALFFTSGYCANFSVLTTLPQKEDRILLDSLVHTSLHEGARAGRALPLYFPHNDLEALEGLLKQGRRRSKANPRRAQAPQQWIVVESLYSMDGDQAPLKEIVHLADKYGAFVIIDEAHATGLYGPAGQGLASPYEGQENIISIHTCGKALGAQGALVTCAAVLADFMTNRARPFIYATAPSPLLAAIVEASLNFVRKNGGLRQKLFENVRFAHHLMKEYFGLDSPFSAILPLKIGNNEGSVLLAKALQARGFDVRPIRPPTVPEGTARLRISITLHVTPEQIDSFFLALKEEHANLSYLTSADPPNWEPCVSMMSFS